MITVFGSINVDLTFCLPHLPGVGETVLAPSISQAVGGKGANQAMAAARDGAATRFVGCVGADGFGAMARAALSGLGIDVTGLATVALPTGLAAVFIDGEGRNQIAVASGANALLRAQALAGAALGTGDLVILQMETPAAEVEAVIAMAKRRGVRVILNLAPALPLPIAALRAVDILVLNEHEAATLCGGLGCGEASSAGRLGALLQALGNTIVITLGAEGAIGGAGGAALWRARAPEVGAVDTTGAGDCFVGVLSGALARGVAVGEAIERAVVAGSLACTIVGALPSFPSSERIDAALAAMPKA
jgi:ribokinase